MSGSSRWQGKVPGTDGGGYLSAAAAGSGRGLRAGSGRWVTWAAEPKRGIAKTNHGKREGDRTARATWEIGPQVPRFLPLFSWEIYFSICCLLILFTHWALIRSQVGRDKGEPGCGRGRGSRARAERGDPAAAGGGAAGHEVPVSAPSQAPGDVTNT